MAVVGIYIGPENTVKIMLRKVMISQVKLILRSISILSPIIETTTGTK